MNSIARSAATRSIELDFTPWAPPCTVCVQLHNRTHLQLLLFPYLYQNTTLLFDKMRKILITKFYSLIQSCKNVDANMKNEYNKALDTSLLSSSFLVGIFFILLLSFCIHMHYSLHPHSHSHPHTHTHTHVLYLYALYCKTEKFFWNINMWLQSAFFDLHFLSTVAMEACGIVY